MTAAGADEVTEGTAGRRVSALPVWLIATIAGFFGLLYAFVVWTALGFLAQQASGSQGLTGYGWFVLILPVAFPLLVFAGAFAIGWKRSALQLTLVLLAGLALVAVFWLNVLSYAAASTSLYSA